MKKILLCLFSLLFCGAVFAAPYDEIIFLGDSLSDNGNLYKLINIPKSPPYYDGRFSNGPTWAENLGEYFHEKDHIDYSIFAIGGATAVLHDTDTFNSRLTLEGELYAYYTDSLFTDRSKHLYVIWIGANDYLYSTDEDMEQLSSQVTDKISWAINSLISHGAQHFLILNLPDLSKTPYASLVDQMDRLHTLTDMHNKKMQEAINNIKTLEKEVTIELFDVHAIFSDLLAHPEKFAEKYKLTIKNVTQACWQGNFELHKPVNKYDSQANFKALLQDSLKEKNKVDVKELTHFILNSPALNQAYLVGKAHDDGQAPCENADEYLFWDQIHPTRIAHQVLSKLAIELLDR